MLDYSKIKLFSCNSLLPPSQMCLKTTYSMPSSAIGISRSACHSFSPLSFLLSCCCVLVFLLASAVSLSAQEIKDCLRDYSLLQQQSRTQWEDLVPGTSLYLNEGYLRKLKYGAFDELGSSIAYFEYVRPATRKEIRLGKVEDFRLEAVGVDGNVYVAKQARGGDHFFHPNAAFEGLYYGDKGDSTLLLPVGLEPLDVMDMEGMPLILTERTTQYLRLEFRGEPVIFYLGYPGFGYVLDTEQVQVAVEDKSSLAKALIGRTFLIRNQSPLRFRSSPQGDDHLLNAERKELKIHVTNTMADRDQVLLITRAESPNYLVLDEDSDFLLFDASCITDKKEQHRIQIQAESEEQGINLRISQLLSDTLDEWTTDPWASEVIGRRFALEGKTTSGPRKLRYLLGDRSNRGRQSFLTAEVDELGTCWMVSQFASHDGLYHTRVIVYLEGDSLFSSRIPALDKRNQRTYKQGWVVERLVLDEDQDRKLLQTIAQSKEGEIRIRFTSGGSYFFETILSPQDHQQIRDVWMLSKMIRRKQDMSMGQPPRN